MRFRFRITAPNCAPFERILIPGESLTIGRGRDSECRISDPNLSRKHCLLRATYQGPEIEDLGSANGTLVRGVRVSRMRLAMNEVVMLGNTTKIEILYPENEAPAPTVKFENKEPVKKVVPFDDPSSTELGPDPRPAPRSVQAAPKPSSSGVIRASKGSRWPVRLDVQVQRRQSFKLCLLPGQSWIFGSSGDADVVLDGPTVTFRLAYTDKGLMLKVLAGASGDKVWVNGLAVADSQALYPGDCIDVGTFEGVRVYVLRTPSQDSLGRMDLPCPRCQRMMACAAGDMHERLSRPESLADLCRHCVPDLANWLQLREGERFLPSTLTQGFSAECFRLKRASGASIVHFLPLPTDICIPVQDFHKKTHQQYRQRLNVLKALQLPRRADILSAIFADNGIYIEERWFEGHCLWRYPQQYQPLSEPTARLLAKQVLQFLRVCEGKGESPLLFPGNIYFSNTDSFKLCILGYGIEDFDIYATGYGAGLGQPNQLNKKSLETNPKDYCFYAPETLENNLNRSSQSSLYNLGALLYYSLTGRAPFQGSNTRQRFMNIEHGRLVPIDHLRDGVSKDFAVLIERLLHKDPGERTSVGVVSHALKALP